MTKDSVNPRFLLLYGSQTGQAKAIAEEIAQNAPSHGLNADLKCFSLTEKKFWLERETCVVIVTSTTGEGEPPDNLNKFWRRIKKKTIADDHFAHLHFAILGLGDSNYTNFCNCSKNVNSRLLELGAKHFYEPGWADDATGLEVVAEPWMEQLWPALRRHLGLPADEASNVTDALINGRLCNGSDRAQSNAPERRSDAADDSTVCDSITLPTDEVDSGCQSSPGVGTNLERDSGPPAIRESDAPTPTADNGRGTYPSSVTDIELGTGASNSKTTSEIELRKEVSSSEEAATDNVLQRTTAAAEPELMESLRHSLPPFSEASLTLPLCLPRFLKIDFKEEKYQSPDPDVIQNDCPFPSARTPTKLVPVVAATQLTADDALKKALKVTVDLESTGFTYEAGDAFGVVCCNEKLHIDKLLSRLGVSEVADLTCHLSVREGTKKKNACVPPHVPPVTSIRHVLTHCCDVMDVAKKAFLRALVEHTSNLREKRRLQEICSKQGAEHFAKYIREPGVCLYDLLLTFPTCQPPLDLLFEHLPRLQARPYSASSSPAARVNLLDFVFNVVDIPEGGGRVEGRMGVCTGWLDALTRGRKVAGHPAARGCEDSDVTALSNRLEDATLTNQAVISIPIHMRKSGLFRPPADLSVPMVMVGPGTGVAPFLGFLQQREKDLASSDVTHSAVGDCWLFYGCRHKDRDYLFRTELEGFQSRGVLNHLHVCFSRDLDPESDHDLDLHPPPRYVHDNIRASGAALSALLTSSDAVVYVCGDAKHMARDVNTAFADVLIKEKGLAENEATALLMTLRIKKRYLEDVWT